jgi:hypothetical protein
MPKSLALALMKSMASMASMELRACLSPAPRGPPDRYHRKKRFLLTLVPPPASLTEMTCTNDGVDDGSQRELTTKPRLAEGAASARDASTARRNRRNRQIYPALTMASRAPAREKWRPAVDLARQTPRGAAARHERKVWQTSVLQLTTAGSEYGKMALLALEKAPFCAIFLTFRTSARDFPEFPLVTGGAPSVRQRGSPTGAAPPPQGNWHGPPVAWDGGASSPSDLAHAVAR